MTVQETQQWHRVSRSNPCVTCGKDSWCTFSVNGFCHCMRVPSERPLDSGGWLHRIEDGKAAMIPTLPAKERPSLSREEIDALVQRFYRAPKAREARRELSDQLGVTTIVLRHLNVGCGWDEYRECWFTSWPERDPAGRFTGLVRRFPDGEKKTYPGTRHGLIYRTPWLRGGKVLFLPEGGSDVAAILTIGLPAVGRPSNLGGVRFLVELLKGYRGEVRVIGERDRKPHAECGDCGKCGRCWPGWFGAVETAKRLKRHGFRARPVLLPGAKDSRAWLNQHPTANSRDFLEATE